MLAQAHCLKLLLKDLQKHLSYVEATLQSAVTISELVRDKDWFCSLLQTHQTADPKLGKKQAIRTVVIPCMLPAFT